MGATGSEVVTAIMRGRVRMLRSSTMAGAGFSVTKGARHITRTGGRLRAIDKAIANRKNRRHTKQDLQARGADALLTPKL